MNQPNRSYPRRSHSSATLAGRRQANREWIAEHNESYRSRNAISTPGGRFSSSENRPIDVSSPNSFFRPSFPTTVTHGTSLCSPQHSDHHVNPSKSASTSVPRLMFSNLPEGFILRSPGESQIAQRRAETFGPMESKVDLEARKQAVLERVTRGVEEAKRAGDQSKRMRFDQVREEIRRQEDQNRRRQRLKERVKWLWGAMFD